MPTNRPPRQRPMAPGGRVPGSASRGGMIEASGQLAARQGVDVLVDRLGTDHPAPWHREPSPYAQHSGHSPPPWRKAPQNLVRPPPGAQISLHPRLEHRVGAGPRATAAGRVVAAPPRPRQRPGSRASSLSCGGSPARSPTGNAPDESRSCTPTSPPSNPWRSPSDHQRTASSAPPQHLRSHPRQPGTLPPRYDTAIACRDEAIWTVVLSITEVCTLEGVACSILGSVDAMDLITTSFVCRR